MYYYYDYSWIVLLPAILYICFLFYRLVFSFQGDAAFLLCPENDFLESEGMGCYNIAVILINRGEDS